MCVGAVTDAGTIVQFAAFLFASINTSHNVIALEMNSFFFSLLMLVVDPQLQIGN